VRPQALILTSRRLLLVRRTPNVLRRRRLLALTADIPKELVAFEGTELGLAGATIAMSIDGQSTRFYLPGANAMWLDVFVNAFRSPSDPVPYSVWTRCLDGDQQPIARAVVNACGPFIMLAAATVAGLAGGKVIRSQSQPAHAAPLAQFSAPQACAAIHAELSTGVTDLTDFPPRMDIGPTPDVAARVAAQLQRDYQAETAVEFLPTQDANSVTVGMDWGAFTDDVHSVVRTIRISYWWTLPRLSELPCTTRTFSSSNARIDRPGHAMSELNVEAVGTSNDDLIAFVADDLRAGETVTTVIRIAFEGSPVWGAFPWISSVLLALRRRHAVGVVGTNQRLFVIQRSVFPPYRPQRVARIVDLTAVQIQRIQFRPTRSRIDLNTGQLVRLNIYGGFSGEIPQFLDYLAAAPSFGTPA
jgi:hypothetical protein